MELTRNQADLALRYYTAEYAEQADKDPDFDTLERFRKFYLNLAAKLGRGIEPSQVDMVLNQWTYISVSQPTSHDYHEQILNDAVNNLLDTAGFPGPHILRYSEHVAA